MYVNMWDGGVVDDMLPMEELKIRTANKSVESEVILAEALGLRELAETIREALKER